MSLSGIRLFITVRYSNCGFYETSEYLNDRYNDLSELLWIAPELLSMTTSSGSIEPGTQKGDVYSFGIILEEIVVRGGPYQTVREFLETKGEIEHQVFLLYIHIYI